MKNKIFILVFMVAFLSFSSYSQAKDESDKHSSKLRRWSISWSTGSTTSRIAAGIERAMRASGYGDLEPIFGTPFPYSTGWTGEGLPWTISIHYLFKPPFLIGVLISKAMIGKTHGFHYVSNSPSQVGSLISIDYGVNTYAPVFSVRYSVFQFGIGPAWYVAKKAWHSDISGLGQANTINKLGFLADLGIAVPQRRRFYFEFKVQYRLIGKVEIGPYEDKVQTALGYETVTFPKTGVTYDYLYFGVGVGIRF